MRYFDLCDYRIQQFRRQGIYPGFIACAPDCTSIILLDLLEHIRIQYIMIDPVCFRTGLWVIIMVHTLIKVCGTIFQVLFRNRKGVSAA